MTITPPTDERHIRVQNEVKARGWKILENTWWRYGFFFLYALAFSYWRGHISSTEDIANSVGAWIAGTVPVILLFYLLNRWWKKRNGPDE